MLAVLIWSFVNFVFGKNILKQMALIQIEFDIKNNDTKLKVIPGTGWWNCTKAYRFEERQFCFDNYINGADGTIIFDNDGYVYVNLQHSQLRQWKPLLINKG